MAYVLRQLGLTAQRRGVYVNTMRVEASFSGDAHARSNVDIFENGESGAMEMMISVDWGWLICLTSLV